MQSNIFVGKLVINDFPAYVKYGPVLESRSHMELMVGIGFARPSAFRQSLYIVVVPSGASNDSSIIKI